MKPIKKWDVILSVFFAAALTVPLLKADFKGGAVSAVENRYLATWPDELFVNKQLNYEGLENWINDNVGGRELVQNISQNVDYRLFGIYPDDTVVLGTDGWRYLIGSSDLPEYQNINPISQESANMYKAEYEAVAADFAGSGIDFYLAMWPRKFTVYPEYMPSTIYHQDGPSDYDVLVDAFENSSVLNFYSACDVLMEKKAHRQTYYRAYDASHWNNYGAFLAYSGLMEMIREDYPDLRVLTEDDFAIEETVQEFSRPFGFRATETDLQYTLQENSTHSDKDYFANHGIVLTDQWQSWNYYYNDADQTLPRAVIVGDSFVWMFMLENLSQSFSELAFIHLNDISQSETVIAQMRADIVICAGLGNAVLEGRKLENPSSQLEGLQEWVNDSGEASLWLERCNGELVEDATLVIPEGVTRFLLSGWARDIPAETAVSKVIIQVGDSFIPAVYGIERPDAVENFGNENYRYVGFECTVDAQRLQEVEELKVFSISADEKSYTVVTFPCTAA